MDFMNLVESETYQNMDIQKEPTTEPDSSSSNETTIPITSASIKPKKKTKTRARKSATPAARVSSSQPISQETSPEPTSSFVSSHSKFPKLVFPRPTEQYNLASEEIFCICRQPDSGGEPMVCCEGCEDWFHFKCVKINSKFEPLLDVYYCPYCELDNKGVTLWKRKCAHGDCLKPIKHGKTKYCCKDHGLQSIREKLTFGGQQNPNNNMHLENLTITALKYSKNLSSFQELGKKLPAVPQSEIPTTITDKQEQELERLHTQRQQHINKRRVLMKAKENLKRLNELINEDQTKTSSSSKKKQKKLELCGYDQKTFTSSIMIDPDTMPSNDINLLKTQYDALQEGSIDGNAAPVSILCLLDKKKCLKHNGWQSIINDEIDLQMNDIQKKCDKVKDTMEKRIRSFTIDYFENLK